MYSELNLLRLKVFVTVVERRGFSAAAAHLNLSQPSVSFHVKALERFFGAKLLVYRQRDVQLTPAGEELYGRAKAMLREGESLALSIRQIQAGQRGRLALGASMAFEQRYFFERVIAPFQRAHPGIQLSLRFGHSVRLVEAVLAREVDLAYVLGWRLPAGVGYEPLHRAEFVFLVAPEHPLAEPGAPSVEDVGRAGIIAAPLDSMEWVHYGEVLRSAGLQQPRVALEVDGVQARILAAQAGLGVFGTFFPPYAGEDAYAPLRPLRLDVPAATAELGLVSRQEEHWTPLMEAFGRWLREVAGAEAAASGGGR